ncbi:MAG: deoxyribose-phosphate aldolase [Elusimicrobiota bacterium]
MKKKAGYKSRQKLPDKIASVIDHTLLRADAGWEEIEKVCGEAVEHSFFSLCVNPCNVGKAVELLKGTQVRVITVAGFPLGANTTYVKECETARALEDGAQEIDMVMNIGALKSGREDVVYRDIKKVKESTGEKILKVIIESAFLNRDEIKKACVVAERAGADFLKTSTGFAGEGARAQDIELMRETLKPSTGIKASGGIRSASDAAKMIKAGAARIGSSRSVDIAGGWEQIKKEVFCIGGADVRENFK